MTKNDNYKEHHYSKRNCLFRKSLWMGVGCTIILLSGCKSKDSHTTALSIKDQKVYRPKPKASGNRVEGHSIKIGLSSSMSGPLRAWGIETIRGAKVAVDEINQAGGIHGKKIDLMVEDNGSKPEQAKTAGEKLISQGVVALISDIPSGLSMSLAQAAYEHGVPMVASGSIRNEVTEIGSNIFRACFTLDMQAPCTAKFAYEELGCRRVSVMTDRKQPYCTGFSEVFKESFKKLGGKIIGEEFYDSGQTQFGAQLTNIKSQNPDLLLLSGYYTEVGTLARQTRDSGIDVYLLGGDGWDSSELMTSGGKAICGSFFAGHYSMDEKRDRVVKFVKAYRKKYHVVPSVSSAPLAYDSLYLMALALKTAKALSSPEITNALDRIKNFDGVTGKITLYGNSGNPPKDVVMVKVTERGFVFSKRYKAEDLQKKNTLLVSSNRSSL